MDLSSLFASINVDRLSRACFAGQIARAWHNARFTDPADGFAGSDLNGATLLKSSNFGLLTSGWFDSNGITFPVELIPKGSAELLQHLHWMIDSRRDGHAVDYLWTAVRRQLPSGTVAKRGGPRRRTLIEVATQLEEVRQLQPDLARALLTGRLGDVLSWFEKHHGTYEAIKWGSLAWSMIIVWALFDLQVVAYRLFHPEWFALEGDRKQPQPMTGETLEKLARELLAFALKCDAEFASGGGLETVSDDLASYIEQHALVQHARRQVALLSISDDPAIADIEALRKYLRFLKRFMKVLLARYDRYGRTPRLELVSHLKHVDGTLKAREAPKKPREEMLIDKSVAGIRFDVPALTALFFSIESMTRDLCEGTVLPLRSGKNLGLRAHARARLARNLFGIYRDIFVRPPHDQAKLSGSEIEHFQEIARNALEQSQADPGLEPLSAGVMRPWLGGVPTVPQLASGGIDEGLNELGPDEWEANYPSSAHTLPVKALEEVTDNPDLYGELPGRVAKLRATFGNLSSTRRKIHDEG